MANSLRRFAVSILAGVCLGQPLAGHANPVIVNGGFESAFNGWMLAEQAGGGGAFYLQSGTLSPVSGTAVPAPTEGGQAAMSDSNGNPGAQVLYQDFVASGSFVLLQFDLLLQSLYADLFSPDTLDFSTVINQQARVDIISSTADVFSVDAADVLQSIYRTQPGDVLSAGYVAISVDISGLMASHAGQTLRLRFAETDNLGEFQMGIDNVRFNATQVVPEPATGWLVAAALWGLLAGGRSRGRAQGFAGGRRCAAALSAAFLAATAQADTTPAALLDPSLQVSVAVNSGLSQPIGVVFLGSAQDYLVAEKASGQIKRVINGVVQAQPVLDLAVNSASERGLLSMAVAPGFPADPFVYLYWTASTSGTDSSAVSDVPLLGNRVDRFVWNGSSLVFDGNLLNLRARQTDNVAVPGHDGTQNGTENGNHNGGPMRIGPDGKLYVFMGDVGRRGWLQNLPNGPFLTAPLVDDTFGGPEPNNAHLSGVVLRVNIDGSAPADNPFFATGSAIGGELGLNIQKIYSYGHRNGFGMDFDPASGSLWLTENADDAYSEINRLMPGLNGGWIQFAGPISRVRDWRTIEALQFGQALQQRRYPPTRAAYTPAAASGRLFMLPGAFFKDPELSARYEIGPSGAAFVAGDALGPANNGTFWFGSARAFSQVGGNGGSLYRLRLTTDRLNVDTSADPRLADKVIDNLFRAQKFDGTEAETLKVGSGFGTVTAIVQGPDGNLYVVSITDNTIYRISSAP